MDTLQWMWAKMARPPSASEGTADHEDTKNALDDDDDDPNEIWDLIRHATATDEKKSCSSEGCKNKVVAVWASDLKPNEEWFTCEDCQEAEFDGWPEGEEPKQSNTDTTSDDEEEEEESAYQLPKACMETNQVGVGSLVCVSSWERKTGKKRKSTKNFQLWGEIVQKHHGSGENLFDVQCEEKLLRNVSMNDIRTLESPQTKDENLSVGDIAYAPWPGTNPNDDLFYWGRVQDVIIDCIRGKVTKNKKKYSIIFFPTKDSHDLVDVTEVGVESEYIYREKEALFLMDHHAGILGISELPTSAQMTLQQLIQQREEEEEARRAAATAAASEEDDHDDSAKEEEEKVMETSKRQGKAPAAKKPKRKADVVASKSTKRQKVMVAKKKRQTETSQLSRTFEVEESSLEIADGSIGKEQHDESQRVVVTPSKVSAGSANTSEKELRKELEKSQSRIAELESMLKWALSKRVPPAESAEESKFWKEEYERLRNRTWMLEDENRKSLRQKILTENHLEIEYKTRKKLDARVHLLEDRLKKAESLIPFKMDDLMYGSTENHLEVEDETRKKLEARVHLLEDRLKKAESLIPFEMDDLYRIYRSTENHLEVEDKARKGLEARVNLLEDRLKKAESLIPFKMDDLMYG